MNTDKIKIFGNPDKRTLEQMVRTVSHEAVVSGVLAADSHVGYGVPIGGVVGYDGHISPSAVGYDIACGNKACLLDIPASSVSENIKSIMDFVWQTLDFGVGRKNSSNGPSDHELFDDDLWNESILSPLKEMAQGQLGTIGSGNHYTDLFKDEQGRAWIGVHFGSRGLGHKIATHFLKAGGATDDMDAVPLVLSMSSDLGRDYYRHMVLAGKYAYAGRDWVCEKIASILGANILSTVHNHHNFGWLEEHGGKELMVVRKGATPAFPGQKGFVGGSMGDISVILEGLDSEEAYESLNSTVHGAGRVLSRTQAAGKKNWKTGGKKSEGLISEAMMHEWIGKLGVELRGAGVDESPHCYKRLPDVLTYHAGSVRILHTLTPLGVAMAGPDTADPFKD